MNPGNTTRHGTAVPRADRPRTSPNHVVIIGYGMAGARLATELSAAPDVEVTVLGAEPHRAYNRILLSSVLAGKHAEGDITLTEAAGHGVKTRTGVTVTAIDRAARTVTLDDGEQLGYDHLVLATGSQAIVPPIPGLETPHPRVAAFRTLEDCRRILEAADGARSALVLGGGLLGLEAARGLAGRGLAVEVVHGVGHLMERQLDPGASAVLVRTLAEHGVAVHLASSAIGVGADADGVTLRLDGRNLRADLLVLSCGVRADTALARAAGLRVERGVVIDETLRTSDPRISAIGDCAQFGEVVGGLVAPAWEQAKVLAARLTGAEPEAVYEPSAPVTRLKASGIDLAAMGTLQADPSCEDVSFADPARGTYARLLIRGDRLAGAVMLGDNPNVGQVIQLFDRKGVVPRDRRALLLGRALGGAEAPVATTSPALMPDNATVCQCNTVTKGALVRCWRAGARTVDDVVARTRATTGCGSCKDAVDGIVGWLSSSDSVGVS
ncbi:FAD-dependent oxidoreductase [Catellatospora sp. IY07-71]|uniref:FAD-dependent oxidoreductase n=1 Tax=Catellatospora sp. IY07-71 TaxID=2728827 RepID=UPI001BB3DADB|nr:FAD-dependent oxidoreductase [Catellatospora sp. IY07-71]